MAHDDFTREQHVEGSSDRTFGLVFACVFFMIAGWPLFQGETPRWWALGPVVFFGMAVLLKPVLLSRLNYLWIRLGVFLGKVVSPIALGVLFYAVLTPIGALIRLTGKDSLRLNFDQGADSYWIPREPPGPPPDSMTNQF